MSLTVFSSLPPGMNRFDQDGRNIGIEHYQSCLQSWRAHGFEIVSVNSANETISDFVKTFAIPTAVIDRDAMVICGKPLVYFSDFMKLIHQRADGPVIITNADIELDLDRRDLDKLQALQRGTFICEPRIDYQHGRKTDGKSYTGGFDFFALHRDDLPMLFDCNLVFGMPWWDHYIPVALLARRFKQIRLSAASGIYHLDHSERWDMERFFSFGHLFRKDLDLIANTTNVSQGFQTMYTRLQVIEQKNPLFPFPRRQNFFGNLFGSHVADPVHNHLLWVAFGNLRLIEQPDEMPMPALSLKRFMQRLPF